MPSSFTIDELRDHFEKKPEDASLLKQARLRMQSGKEGVITEVIPRRMKAGGPLITIDVSGEAIRVSGFKFVEEIVFDGSINEYHELRDAIDERVTIEENRQTQIAQRLREQWGIEQRLAEGRIKNLKAVAEKRKHEDERLAEEERKRLREMAEARERERAEREARIDEHRGLFEQFDIEIEDNLDPSDELIFILSRIVEGDSIADEGLESLRNKGFGVVVGHYFFRKFYRGDGNWLVPKACKEWRNARRQDLTIDLVVPYVEGEAQPSLARDHAVLNNVATAYYDYRRFKSALRFAEESVRLRPDSDRGKYKGYCLLVQISDGLGDSDRVAKYRNLAVESSPNREGCSKTGARTQPKFMPKNLRFGNAE
ncbi:MAG: hypothetical protein QM589_06420 [Thermomicrobiales bacterium]